MSGSNESRRTRRRPSSEHRPSSQHRPNSSQRRTKQRRPRPRRSPKVKTILHLEGRAARLRAGYEGALARVAPGKHRAEELLQQARAIKVTLKPSELSELRRARSGV